MPFNMGRLTPDLNLRPLTLALLTFETPTVPFPVKAPPTVSPGLTLGVVNANYAIPGGAPAAERAVAGVSGNGARMVWGAILSAPVPAGYPPDYYERTFAKLIFSSPVVLGGDFTAEAWFYKDAGYSGNGLFQMGAFIVRLDSSNLDLGGLNTSVTGYVESAATWNHVALMRRSGVWYAFMNGIKVAQATDVQGALTFDAWSVGEFGAGSTGPFGSAIDNARLSAVARYSTAGFTVPSPGFVVD